MRISRSYWIAAPPDELVEELNSSEAARIVTPWVHTSEIVPEGPLAAGKKIKITYRRGLLVRRRQTTAEVLCYDPPRAVTVTTKGRVWNSVITHSYVPDGEGTRINTVVDAKLATLAKPLKPFIAALLHWDVWSYHRNIRAFIETDIATQPRRRSISRAGAIASWIFLAMFAAAFTFDRCS